MTWETRKPELADELVRRIYEAGVIRTWRRDKPEGWEIVSGRWSPFYVMMRNAPSDPELFRFMVDASAELIANELPGATCVVGLAATGIPIAAALGYRLGMPMGFNRKLPNVRSLAALEQEVGMYGGHSLVEGVFRPGDRVVLLDDVVSHFDSKEIALRQFELELERRGIEGVEVEGVAVLVDRGNEAQQRAEAYGVRLVSLAVLLEGQIEALRGVASDREVEVIADYLRDPDPFQPLDVRQALAAEAAAVGST
jgi:orotate phosphoribosyltransferase